MSKISLPGPHSVLPAALKHLIENGNLKQSAIRLEIFPVFSRTAGNFGHRFASSVAEILEGLRRRADHDITLRLDLEHREAALHEPAWGKAK